MDEAARRHNDLAGDLVRQLVKGTIGAGGDATETLVVLESVLVGTFLALVRLGGDEQVLDTVTAGARARLAELRLKDISTEGGAPWLTSSTRERRGEGHRSRSTDPLRPPTVVSSP